MKNFKDILQIILLLAIGGYFVYQEIYIEKLTHQELHDAFAEYEQKMLEGNSRDSTYLILLDSIASMKEGINSDLQDLRYQNYKTRQSNEQISETLDSLSAVTGERPIF